MARPRQESNLAGATEPGKTGRSAPKAANPHQKTQEGPSSPSILPVDVQDESPVYFSHGPHLGASEGLFLMALAFSSRTTPARPPQPPCVHDHHEEPVGLPGFRLLFIYPFEREPGQIRPGERGSLKSEGVDRWRHVPCLLPKTPKVPERIQYGVGLVERVAAASNPLHVPAGVLCLPVHPIRPVHGIPRIPGALLPLSRGTPSESEEEDGRCEDLLEFHRLNFFISFPNILSNILQHENPQGKWAKNASGPLGKTTPSIQL